MRSNVTGVGFYNSESRNPNRGFGRGNPRPFQSSQPPPSPQPPRRGDIFMEAGRLAVEYLISRGLLSSNVLSGKWQNGSLRNNLGESQDLHSSQDRDIPNSHDDRSVSSSRRSPNNQDTSMSRSYYRERRRYGASRSHSSDWSRESGREGSLSEKGTPSQAIEVDNDKFHKDNANDADTDPHSTDSADKNNTYSESKQEIGMCRHIVDSDSKMTSMLEDKANEGLPKLADGVKTGCEETKDCTANRDKEQQTHEAEPVIQHPEENPAIQHPEEKNNTSTTDGLDLFKLCQSIEIPTKVHSFLTNKSPTSDPLLISKENNITETGHECIDSMKEETTSVSSGVPTPSSICLGAAISDQSFKDTGALDPAHALDKQKSVQSLSFSDKSFSYEQNATGLPELQMCNSFENDRGEKRALEEDNLLEGAKKAKQWLSVAQSDGYLQLSNLSEKLSTLPSKRSVDFFSESANQGRFTNVPVPAKGGVEAAMDQVEQKQPFSSSFKICDLNLMEASDMHEGHVGTALLYPSRSAPCKGTPIDIDLSISNSCSLFNQHNDSGSVRNDIEIIDLESGSLEEGKSSNTSTRNTESGITKMESFPNNPENLNDNPDGQDGYGFMISELLGNDVPNCSSVQPDPLHNDISLHHGEGIFTEDDPIYMSLGEIPLSMPDI